MVYNASKAFVKGWFVQCNQEFKKKIQEEIQVILDEIFLKRKSLENLQSGQ